MFIEEYSHKIFNTSGDKTILSISSSARTRLSRLSHISSSEGCSIGVLVDRSDPILVPIDVCMWWQDYVWVTESVPRPFVTSRLNREPTAFEKRRRARTHKGDYQIVLPQTHLPPKTPLHPEIRHSMTQAICHRISITLRLTIFKLELCINIRFSINSSMKIQDYRIKIQNQILKIK